MYQFWNVGRVNKQWKDFEWEQKCTHIYSRIQRFTKIFPSLGIYTPPLRHQHYILYHRNVHLIHFQPEERKEKKREQHQKNNKFITWNRFKMQPMSNWERVSNQRPAQQLTIWYRFCVQLYVRVLYVYQSLCVSVCLSVWAYCICCLHMFCKFHKVSVVRCTRSSMNNLTHLLKTFICAAWFNRSLSGKYHAITHYTILYTQMVRYYFSDFSLPLLLLLLLFGSILVFHAQQINWQYFQNLEYTQAFNTQAYKLLMLAINASNKIWAIEVPNKKC